MSHLTPANPLTPVLGHHPSSHTAPFNFVQLEPLFAPLHSSATMSCRQNSYAGESSSSPLRMAKVDKDDVHPSHQVETTFFESIEAFDDIWRPRPIGPFSLGDMTAICSIHLTVLAALILTTRHVMDSAVWDDTDLERRQLRDSSVYRLWVAYWVFFLGSAAVVLLIRRTNRSVKSRPEPFSLEKFTG